ncbi:hypothetical protein LCGC14_0569690 [marine sediment metagenome]|uniref:HNH nuclease domain-containing protein n=1 Tax=marine sediment metagenome TaxID=412755 RepID=A0A0F9S338_9ZZZZ
MQMKKRNKKGQFEREYSDNNYKGYKIYYDKKGYPCIWFDGKNKKVHILVWEERYGTKPKGYDIHHKDFDKSNYDINNLELLLDFEHKRIHAGGIMINKKWIAKPCTICKKTLPLNAFYERKTLKYKTQSGYCKECSRKRDRGEL